MDNIRLAGLALLCICTMITAVAANSITANVGETWIKWQWTAYDPPFNGSIYIDGRLDTPNTTFNYAYIQRLEPLEEHNVRVYNGSNSSELLYSSTVMTTYPLGNILLFVGVQIVLIIILQLLKDPYKIILIGAATISLALYTSSISTGHGGLYILPLILAVAAGVVMAINLVELARSNIKWY